MGTLYEELSNVPTNEDVIPPTCLSFFEQARYIAEYAEQLHNEMFSELGLDELRAFEEGTFAIYEASEKENINKKGSKKTVKLFGAIKKNFESINLFFKTAAKNGKKVAASVDAKMIDSCPDVICKSHTFFDYKKINFAKKADAIAKKVNAFYSKKGNISVEEAKKFNQELSKSIFKDITGVDATDTEQLKKKLRAELIGDEIEVTKDYAKKNLDQIKNLVSGGIAPQAVKDFYNDQKKSMSMHYGLDSSDAVYYWDDAITAIFVVVIYAYNTVFDAYKRMYREYMNILLKISKYGKKKVVKEEAQPNDADEGNQGPKDVDPNDKSVKEPLVEDGCKKESCNKESCDDDDDSQEDALEESVYSEYSLMDSAFDF